MLKGKVTIMTGAASSTGLGVTRVLAGAGPNIALDSFGEPDAILPLRERVAQHKQFEAPSARQQISFEEARFEPLATERPKHQFVTPEQLESFALFLFVGAAAQLCGHALRAGAGWTAH